MNFSLSFFEESDLELGKIMRRTPMNSISGLPVLNKKTE